MFQLDASRRGVGHHIYFRELAMHNASRLLCGRVIHDQNTEVDGATAITMNCSAVICVRFRGYSNAPGSLITAKFTAAILKLSDLRHYHCLPSHVFAKRDGLLLQRVANDLALCRRSDPLLPKSGRLAPEWLAR
jgi:hypothetical protein